MRNNKMKCFIVVSYEDGCPGFWIKKPLHFSYDGAYKHKKQLEKEDDYLSYEIEECEIIE